MKAKRKTAEQQALFDAPRYGWKSVLQIRQKDIIVIFDQETRVLGIRQEGGIWWISYIDPVTGTKAEQFYSSHDSVFARLQEEESA